MFQLISNLIINDNLIRCIIFQLKSIAKNKREKALEINELAKKGGGESYIDSSRGIAVGMGK